MANEHTTLKSLFDDTADAIRELTGSTEQIVADKFPEAIRAYEPDFEDVAFKIMLSIDGSNTYSPSYEECFNALNDLMMVQNPPAWPRVPVGIWDSEEIMFPMLFAGCIVQTNHLVLVNAFNNEYPAGEALPGETKRSMHMMILKPDNTFEEINVYEIKESSSYIGSSDVKVGKVYATSTGELKYGTMPEISISKPSIEVDSQGGIHATVTYGAGYTTGGTVEGGQQLNVQGGGTITPTKSEQIVIGKNMYTLNDIKVGPIPDRYPDVSGVTVTSDSMLEGRTSFDKNGNPITGTIPGVRLIAPTISINEAGLITSSVTQNEGYILGETRTSTEQLATQAAKTVTPTTAEQTVVSSGKFTTGDIKVGPIPSNYEDVTAETNEYTSLADELEEVINSLPEAGGSGGASVAERSFGLDMEESDRGGIIAPDTVYYKLVPREDLNWSKMVSAVLMVRYTNRIGSEHDARYYSIYRKTGSMDDVLELVYVDSDTSDGSFSIDGMLPRINISGNCFELETSDLGGYRFSRSTIVGIWLS